MKAAVFSLALSLTLLGVLHAQEACSMPSDSDEALQISLTTETNLSPLAVVWSSSTGDNPEYKRLESVLQFDIDHSGYLQILKLSSDKLKVLNQEPHNDLWASWRSFGARYVLQIQMSATTLRAKLFDTVARRSCPSPEFTLCGKLAQDRRQIHRLSDWLLQTSLSKKGIARSSLLYTVTVGKQGGQKFPRTQIWQSDYDGANAKMIMQQNTLLVTPCYLPHQGPQPTHFAVVSYQLGQPKVLLSDMNGNFKRASALGGSQLSPSTDAQGRQLAFVCDVEGNPDIYLMRVDWVNQTSERARKLFSCKRGTQASPTFNPTGRQMALVSSKDGSPRIYLIDIQQQLTQPNVDSAKLISRKNQENTCPTWSPDGRYIAYSARNSGPRQIWIYDTQTQTETCLTKGQGIKENPSWASDSLHLFYNQEDSSGCHLYMINLNQKAAVRISRHQEPTRFPCASK